MRAPMMRNDVERTLGMVVFDSIIVYIYIMITVGCKTI
jgi:hypothetical protein